MRLNATTAPDFVLADVDRQFTLDPYPVYRLLRDHAPMCRQPDGSWLVTRYADVREALGNAQIFSSDKHIDFKPRFGESPLYEHHTTSIVFNDAPYHTRVRRLLAPFFAARVLREMEHSIGAMVDKLLDRAAQQGTIDIVEEFALVIPLNLIGDLLGVPYSERQPLRAWARAILGALEPVCTPAALDLGNAAVVEFKTYLRQLIARKRAHPPGADNLDVLWALVSAHDQDAELSELEILHNAIFMLNAGHDTTGSLIANGVDLLLDHPEQMQRLRDEPGLMKSAIEEMLRVESPLQIGNRRALCDTELGGEKIAAGSFLHLVIASANRDERQFPAAENFDVARSPNKHLAFAHGIHTCAGNSVARIEAVIAFSKLLQRFPRMRRVAAVDRAERTRFRIVERLLVELEP